VWGEEFVGQFLEYSLPTLLAPGNLPALARALPTHFVFLTRARDEAAIRAHPACERLAQISTVEFLPIDDLVTSGNHSTTITLAYARAVRSTGSAMLDTGFFFLVSDYIMADGSLEAVWARIEEGASAVQVGNFQLAEETAEPWLRQLFVGAGTPVALSPREVMHRALGCLHPVTVANIVNFPMCHNFHTNRLLWRVDNETLIGRFYLLHMICIRPERTDFVIGSSCDYSFVPEMCPSGNVAVLIQPARGYNLDPKATYHDPALVPPHSYLAAYAWLADSFRADAVIDLGKHGTLEWLPGKALALSSECFPEAVLGPLPHLYPFIVNDPGEGSQAKRRSQAVIVDHLTPPLTRAGSYGPQAELERLIDEYYDAVRGDPRRVEPLAAEILERARAAGIDRDCGIAAAEDPTRALQKLDGFLCELKELQIRDGLHVFGQSPEAELLDALIVAFARARRGSGADAESLLRALAADLGLGADPLMLDLAEPWTGPRPDALAQLPPPQPSPACGGGSARTGPAGRALSQALIIPMLARVSAMRTRTRASTSPAVNTCTSNASPR
jgi:hypothetical protein